MALKVDAITNGYQALIYDTNDASRTPVWRCLCLPSHTTKIEAKACARKKLAKLKGRK